MRQHNGNLLTQEQNAIIDAALSGESIKITAYAGAAKTTTLVAMASEPAMRERSGLYLAFGADAAKDAKKKFDGLNVTVLTTHGLALRWLNENFPAVNPHGTGYRGFEIAEKYNIADRKPTGWSKVISGGAIGYMIIGWIGKFCGSGDDKIEMKHAPLSAIPGYPMRLSPAQARDKRFAEEIRKAKQEIATQYLETTRSLWKSIISDPLSSPISHDIYLKMWSLANPMLAYDYVMLDEAQDTSGAVISVLNNSTIQKIIVGDSHQSIYDFRGAINAMEKIRTEFEYMLSTSFRYGQSVAGLASTLLSETKQKEVKISGQAGKKTEIKAELTDGVNPDVIICRTNEGALSQAIEYMSMGKNVKLKHSTSSGELLRKIQAIQQIMNSGSTRLHKDYEDFSRRTFAEYVESDQGKGDKTLLSLLDKFGMSTIEKVLENGAKKRNDVIEIITAHRSKGLEWDSVLLAHDFPETKEDYERDQEANLLYVAMTRCKTNLDVSMCPVLVEMFGGKGITPIKTVKTESATIEKIVFKSTQVERTMVACTSCQQDKCQHGGADYSKQGHPFRHTSPQLRWCNDFSMRIG